jgi:hypothetical protein
VNVGTRVIYAVPAAPIRQRPILLLGNPDGTEISPAVQITADPVTGVLSVPGGAFDFITLETVPLVPPDDPDAGLGLPGQIMEQSAGGQSSRVAFDNGETRWVQTSDLTEE